MPSGIIQSKDNPRYDCQVFTLNTYSDMFKGLGFDGHHKASFLAGMVGLEGSGAYFKDLKAGARSVKVTLKLEVGTMFESLNMSHRALERCLSDFSLEDIKQATHFVGGVQWGANAYASVESESSMGIDSRGIEARLSARLSELGASLLQLCTGGVSLGALMAQFRAGKGRHAIEDEEKFKFRVDADVLPDSTENMILPKNLEEAWTLLSRIPAQLVHTTSQGRGRPLRFTLYPLSQLEKKVPQLIISIAPRCTSFTSPSIEGLERLFNELQYIKQDLHDLFEDVSINHFATFSSHDIENIAAFRNDVEAAEGQLRAAVCEQVVAIRSQKGEVAGLEKLIRDFSIQSQSAPSKARAFMAPYKRKLKRIISLKEQGVQFVLQASSSTTSSLASSTESFPISCNNGASIWVVVLSYWEPNGKNNQQEWNNNWNTFWHLRNQGRCGQAHNNEPAVTDVHFVVQENQDGECTCKTKVSVLRDGDVVSEDTALLMLSSPQSNKLRKNLVYSSVTHEVKLQPPNARIPLQTYCPGHHVQSPRMSSCAEHVIRDWACERCEGCIEYGKNGFLYCACGRAPLRACRFRCSSQKHGPLFVAFPASEDVARILERQEAPQQLNILLLGETGVDQKTFEMREIKFGQRDSNELHHEGQSSTQACRSYTFPLSQHQTVHLIDTPGVGDTRGIEYDQVNFQNILSYLTHYTEIHGICVMLKPNTSRLTVTFRFCIMELLRHLHKSASENIVFLFTNARSTFYTPGDTTVPLTTLLREIQNAPPHVHIAYNRRTVYCMDNEAFRYLLALREGCFFPPEVKASYLQSWTMSADECHRMLEHFRSLRAHNVRETVSLNQAWSLVSKLQKPLEDVTNAIQYNLTKWAAMKKELEEFQGNNRDLERIFKDDKVLNLQAVPLKKGARTVCTSMESCCERRESIDGEIEVFYKRVCHEPCSTSKVVRVLAQGNSLWFCKVMDMQGICRVCKCHYKQHKRITYNTKLVPQKVVSEYIETKLHSDTKTIEAKELKILELGQRIEEWQQELDIITQACARFALFFKNNSITPVNNDMKAYVHHQIAVERSRGEYDRPLIARWQAFLEAYQKQINDLERMISMKVEDRAHTEKAAVSRRSPHKNPSLYGTAEEIMQLAENLYRLKHHGPTIKALAGEVSHCECRTQFHSKTYHGRRPKNVAGKLKARVIAYSGEGPLQCIIPRRVTDERSYQNEVSSSKLETYPTGRSQSSSQVGSKPRPSHWAFPARSCAVSQPVSNASSSTHKNSAERSHDIDQSVQEATALCSSARGSTRGKDVPTIIADEYESEEDENPLFV
ncbi:hypothetical protein GOP47_0023911 [Adiantum capillus-veneris]|uniref:Uncharacterized protein n=1 Tax=Adiantum capillus-veneris TaxID=13818 RepID=A0A9D4Z6E0_ADICA|nr:hypothetical protein GOP47_0023911 [Adiantum capillus-veneris]